MFFTAAFSRVFLYALTGFFFLGGFLSVDAEQVNVGSSVTLSVTAEGTAPFSYQWQKDATNISSATASTFTLSPIKAADAGSYTVVVSNTAGSTTSAPVALTVQAVSTASAPTISSQPASQSVTAGGAASFTVAANGSPAPTYQWYFGGGAISGATSATLSLSNVQSANASSYYVAVANSAGSAISASATLTVTSNQTSSQIVTTGHEVTLTAAGASAGGQWQVSTDSGATWSALTNTGTYAGVNTSTLTITGVDAGLNGYRYRYVTSTSTGAVMVLTVSTAFFPFPAGIAADGSGNLYVADTSADTIQKISAAGAVTLLAGTAGQTGSADGSGTNARFNDPSGLTSSSDGTLAVVDNANGTIRLISAAGVVTTLAGSTTVRGNTDGTGAAAAFSSPLGIAQDTGGNFYVADATNNTIRKITPGGTVSTLAGNAGVTGSNDGTGGAARFNHPTGIAVDGSGTIYVSDTTNNTIRKITATGTVTTLAGLAGVSGTQDGNGSGALFNNPSGLAVDASGNLYLADTGNSTIRKITAAGAVTTLAGLPGIAGMMDGSGGSAWFNQPKGVALDSSGNLCVADTGNAAIRRITTAGAVTTLALTAGTSVVTPTPTTTSNSTSTSSSTGSTSSSSSGGGGGGAMEGSMAAALGFLLLIRNSLKRRDS